VDFGDSTGGVCAGVGVGMGVEAEVGVGVGVGVGGEGVEACGMLTLDWSTSCAAGRSEVELLYAEMKGRGVISTVLPTSLEIPIVPLVRDSPSTN
jgi:hypothetical protein